MLCHLQEFDDLEFTGMVRYLTVKRARILPFSSAVISSLMPLTGAILLAKIVWRTPWGTIPAMAGSVLLLLLLIVRLRRIHTLFKDLDRESIENTPLQRRVVNETIRVFTWGSAVFSLLAIAVFQYHLLK